MDYINGLAERISSSVKEREDQLRRLVKQDILNSRPEADDITFIVARRWNSWYPSYFDVAGGGSYLIQTVAPRSSDKDDESEPSEKPGFILVDPGYGFLSVVRSLRIDPKDIDTVIITHFHPDHMSGIFEYVNLRIELEPERPTSIYMNPTTFAALGRSGRGNIDIFEFPPGSAVNLANYKRRDGIYERIIARAVQTYHQEISNTSHSIGLIFEIEQSKSQFFDEGRHTKTIGIIGDTDAYHTHLMDYARDFYQCDVLVLHIGTFSPKLEGRPGKHLYLMGVRRLLDRLKIKREDDRFLTEKNQLILISEFGMEHAAPDQLYRAVSERLEVRSCQAMLGYYVEQALPREDSKTSLAGIGYAYWLYHQLVKRLTSEDTAALLVAIGLGSMLCAYKACKPLMPEPHHIDAETDRDVISKLIIRHIGEKCEEFRNESLLFGIPSECQIDLDKKNIPSSLGQKLGSNGISLSQDINVLIKVKGKDWLIIDEGNQKIYSVRQGEEELNVYNEPNPLVYWATRLLTDAILSRVSVYDVPESVRTKVEAQSERLREALSTLDGFAQRALSEILWRAVYPSPFDEIEGLNERIKRELQIRDLSIDLMREVRRYNDQPFQEILLYSIVGINYLKAAVENVWPVLEGMILDISEPILKDIEKFFREQNDNWAEVFVAEIGCEVVMGRDEIQMRTFDGKTAKPEEVISEYSPAKGQFIYKKVSER